MCSKCSRRADAVVLVRVLLPPLPPMPQAPPAQRCKTKADCKRFSLALACREGLCCTPPGSTARSDSLCCPGSLYWYPTSKCCYVVGAPASSAKQCCTGRMIDNICAPKGDVSGWLPCGQKVAWVAGWDVHFCFWPVPGC